MSAARFEPVVATAFALPLRICEMDEIGVAKKESTCPPRKPCMAGPPPLYGTWSRCVFDMPFRSSPARWPALPIPEDA
jgi:hypothetical protein